jgi:hypothetical protein
VTTTDALQWCAIVALGVSVLLNLRSLNGVLRVTRGLLEELKALLAVVRR